MADPNPTTRSPEISGLRGLAVLIVVGGHFVQRVERFNPIPTDSEPTTRLMIECLSCPTAGVHLFFAVSGYLIACRLSTIDNRRLTELGRFYLRRFLRIAPPYYVLLILTWALLEAFAWKPPRTNLYDVKPASLFDSLIASLSYVHGLAYGTYPRLFPPGWTLEVEVQFYLLAPFLYGVFRQMAVRFGHFGASALAFGASGVIAVVAIRSGIDRLQTTLLVYLPLFLLGMAAYEVKQSGWRPPLAPLMSALGWPALIGFIVMQPWLNDTGVEGAVRMALIAVMLCALAVERGAFFRMCTHPIVVRIGIASFSIYLVHLQVMHVTTYVFSKYVGELPIVPALMANGLITAPLIYVAARFYFRNVERPSYRLNGIAILREGGLSRGRRQLDM